MKLNKPTIVAAAVGAVGLLTLAYGAYLLVATEPVLAWAIIATLLIPIAGLVGWALGRYEVAALLRGVDLGADRVVAVAEKIADIKDRRQPGKDDRPNLNVLLPQVTVTHRNLLDRPGDGGETIDL
jgi:hypothetical protein